MPAAKKPTTEKTKSTGASATDADIVTQFDDKEPVASVTSATGGRKPLAPDMKDTITV